METSVVVAGIRWDWCQPQILQPEESTGPDTFLSTVHISGHLNLVPFF